MTDHNPSNPSPDNFSEAAQKSLDAGIADESAAYEQAIDLADADANAEVAEGKWKSTDDGSGTSETD